MESTLADNATDDYGAGILNSGTLTFTRSTLSGNTTIAYYGGGLHNAGDVSFIESTISGNSAPWGGAILKSGTVQIVNSTLAGNIAPDTGGIINSEVVTLTNSIIPGNPGGNCEWYVAGVFGDGDAVCDIGSFEFQVPPTTTITSDDPDPSFEMQAFMVSFSVTATNSLPTGAGTVTVDVGDQSCSSTILNGFMNYPLTLTIPSTYTLTARYSGDPIHAPSTGTELHTVIAYYKAFLPVIMGE
jgi:hypothetical protein